MSTPPPTRRGDVEALKRLLFAGRPELPEDRTDVEAMRAWAVKFREWSKGWQ